jgi:hypothetical protein
MQQIDIDFAVFKRLTAMCQHESHTYNELLRDLLDLPQGLGRALTDGIVKGPSGSSGKPFVLRGGQIGHGTKLRATYKGVEHTATIGDGRWVNDKGTEQPSPSAAAKSITGTNVNGLRFWHAMPLGRTSWVRLDTLLAMAK